MKSTGRPFRTRKMPGPLQDGDGVFGDVPHSRAPPNAFDSVLPGARAFRAEALGTDSLAGKAPDGEDRRVDRVSRGGEDALPGARRRAEGGHAADLQEALRSDEAHARLVETVEADYAGKASQALGNLGHRRDVMPLQEILQGIGSRDRLVRAAAEGADAGREGVAGEEKGPHRGAGETLVIGDPAHAPVGGPESPD